MPDPLQDVDRLNSALADRYIIERELGQGGMATVYLANDVKHERKVAVKVLRPELAAVLGPERFLREIKLTARLNHPHILTLLDSGDVQGLLYYVMPYVEGEALRQKLNRETQLSIDDALRYAQQVAAALHYAHGQGVMHRDIKPENILLNADEAMVADFGIALALDAAGGDRLTETGLSIGTPEYMSPEQASGAEQLDARSDVYALACVLHEMLTGDPPFTAQTPRAIIARQVLDPPPSIRTVRSSVSAEVEAVVQRALAKAPADRWQTAEQFQARLKTVAPTTGDATPLAAPVRAKPSALSGSRVAIGIGLAMVVGIVAVFLTGRSGLDTTTPIAVPTQVTLTGRSGRAAISPDGAYLAYTKSTDQGERIMVQDVGGGAALEVGFYQQVISLHWSPNGSDLLVAGIADPGGSPGVVSILSRFGGEPRRLPRGAAHAKWSPNGQRVVVWWMDIKELGVIDPVNGDSVGVPLPEQLGYMNGLDWSPDGQWFAILTFYSGEPYRILTVAADGSDVHEIVRDTAALAGPLWTPDGKGVYYLRRNGATSDLMAVQVSMGGQPVGKPVPVLSGVPALDAAGQFVEFPPPWPTISADGARMLFARDESRANLWTISTAQGGGSAVQRTRGTATKSFPRLSPTGDAIAYLEAARGRTDVWIDSLNGAGARRVTFDGGFKYQLAWAPTGNQLAYGVRSSGTDILHIVTMDGVVREFPETTIGGDIRWPDERFIIHNPGANNQLLKLDLTDGSSTPLLESRGEPFYVAAPRVSPDGRRISFWWNLWALDDDDIWTLEIDAGTPRRLGVGNYMPIGWDTNGTHILAMSGTPGTTVYAIHELEGVVRPVAEFPFATIWQQVDFNANTETVVAALKEEQMDIWMIEDFDRRRR